MLRRAAIVLAASVVSLAGFSVAPAAGAEIFGHQVAVGTTVPAATAVPGVLSLTDVTVTSAANGQVSASANLYVGASTVPMAVALQYTDRSNWTIGISRGSAGASYAPVNGTTLNINQISGTITNTAGNISHFLTLSGYTIGDATFDLVASFDETGLTASALVSDLEMGGSTLETATITVSTATPEVDITATLDSDAGNFDAEIKASGPLPPEACPTTTCGPPQPRYHEEISVSGADLAGGTSKFHLQAFSFSASKDTPSWGCTTLDVDATGSATIENNTYTLKDAHLTLSCSTVTSFKFAVEFSHYEKWKKQTLTADLTIAWSGVPGTFKGPEGSVRYQQGYFGAVDLSQQRTFSKKYKGRTFHRGVKIGLGFGVAVYQPSAGAAWVSDIGAAGYFDADRVSGIIGCVFQLTPGTDMNCGGKLRLNPSWAGVYHFDWNDL